MSLTVLSLVTGDLQENCVIVWLNGRSDAVVFDPGADEERILAELSRRGLTISALALTHCHVDHIGALGALKEAFPAAPIYCPEEEAEWLQRPTLNLSYFFGAPVKAPPADVLVRGGQDLELAGIPFRTLHVPGHSPGSTAYYWSEKGGSGTEAQAPQLVAGDTLFKEGIGRTDLPGGAGEEVLLASIVEQIFPLPNETVIYPGHGPSTTLAHEKSQNPFLP